MFIVLMDENFFEPFSRIDSFEDIQPLNIVRVSAGSLRRQGSTYEYVSSKGSVESDNDSLGERLWPISS